MSLTTLILLYCPTHVLLPSILSVPWSPCRLHSPVTVSIREGRGGPSRHIHQIRYLLLESLPSKGRAPGPCPQVSRFSLLSLQAPAVQPFGSIIRFLSLVWSVHMLLCPESSPPQHVGLLRPSLTTLFSLIEPPLHFLPPASASHSWHLS